MRVHILSDLHLEFGPFGFPQVGAELVILAGDIHTKLNGLKWVRETIPQTPVLYLMGNHEYYGSELPRLTEKLKEQVAGTNVHILENDSFELGGFRFFGATLWTDLQLHGDAMRGGLEALVMNDYRRIRVTPRYRRLRPSDTRALHQSTLKALSQFVASGDSNRSVVITHHAPSIRSLPDLRRAQPVSCAYASHLDSRIEELRPLLWIHGHVHHSHDYLIGSTRVIANPRGYFDEPNPDFKPAFVVDLEAEYRQRIALT
jgi:predicted phosphohydrolase